MVWYSFKIIYGRIRGVNHCCGLPHGRISHIHIEYSLYITRGGKLIYFGNISPLLVSNNLPRSRIGSNRMNPFSPMSCSKVSLHLLVQCILSRSQHKLTFSFLYLSTLSLVVIVTACKPLLMSYASTRQYKSTFRWVLVFSKICLAQYAVSQCSNHLFNLFINTLFT